MVWERGKYFLMAWSVFFCVGIVALEIHGKTGLHILLNAWQPRTADIFFKTITYVGEGIAFVVVALWLLWRSRYAFFFMLTSWLGTVLTIQFLKKVVYSDALRPASIFEKTDAIYFVEGVTYRFLHSFPSGHTGDIFAVCFSLCLLSPYPQRGIVFFVPALLVAYSRVFLSQHFMEDILAGSFIAIFVTSVSCYVWWRMSQNFRDLIYR